MCQHFNTARYHASITSWLSTLRLQLTACILAIIYKSMGIIISNHHQDITCKPTNILVHELNYINPSMIHPLLTFSPRIQSELLLLLVLLSPLLLLSQPPVLSICPVVLEPFAILSGVLSTPLVPQEIKPSYTA